MKTNFDNMGVANCKTTNPFIKPEWLEQLANTAFLGHCQNGQISK